MSRAPGKDFRRVKVDGQETKEKGQGPENEIKVTAKGGQRSYITYAIALLNGEEGKTKYDTIKVSGMGVAIYNAVNIAEIVKRRVKGVHQITEISSQVVQDMYESVDKEKDEKLEVERKVSTILITLSTKQLDKKHVGYQAPLADDQVTEQEDRPRPARRERRPAAEGAAEGAADEPKAEGRGRGGRGSGRGRGGSRGGRGGSGRGGRGGSSRGRGGRGGEGSGRGRGGAEAGTRGSGRGGRGSGRGGADRREDRTVDTGARGGRGKN